MSFACNIAQCVGQCSDKRQINRDIVLTKNAYQSLSPEEQDRADRDLYGTETSIFETHDFVESKLAELDGELGHISEERKKYYNRAIDFEKQELERVGGEEYVGSANFRLMFLRADLFDAHLAAKRLISYFKEKYDLFGEEKLALRIKQVDLNDEETMSLYSGALTYLGTTDFAGRPVLVCRRCNLLTLNPICLKRMTFYLYHKMFEDNEIAQKKGIVVIDYNMGNVIPFKLQFLRSSLFPVMRMIVNIIPYRLAAYHDFYEDMKEHFIINLALVVHPRTDRARFLAHYQDTYEECMAICMTFGISPDSLPLTDQGEFRYEITRDYLEMQKRLEK